MSNLISKISVVIPIYNEEGSVEELDKKLSESMRKLGKKYELIYIDDGSTDNSFKILKSIVLKGDKNKHLIGLRRNFGKSQALTAGFRLARGDLVITIDADLQDNPAEIVKLVKQIEEGYDIVIGWRKMRRDRWEKIFLSKIFNMIATWIVDIKLHDINCGLKAFRKDVIDKINVYGGLYRFIPILAYQLGFSVAEVTVRHFPRRQGKSKYGLKRVFGGGIDLVTIYFLSRYRNTPAHFFGILGVLIFTIGFVVEVYITTLKFVTGTIQGHLPLLLFGILSIVVGIQLISLGLLGEFLLFFGEKKQVHISYFSDDSVKRRNNLQQ